MSLSASSELNEESFALIMFSAFEKILSKGTLVAGGIHKKWPAII